MSDTQKTTSKITAAELLLHRLSALGIEYVFVNSGTDHLPLIEALAKAQAEGSRIPEFLICPHESAAMGMAQGYYYATGRGQAVITHTNVGLANAICGLINAWNDNVPTFLLSGRTPITEGGRFGARSTPVNYGQEMRDQTALVRESVKWDFELREPEQIGDLVDRGHAIANSAPKGPVFLGLPREPLCESFDCADPAYPSPLKPASYAPRAEDVAQATRLVAGASHPVIIAQHGAGSQKGFDLLSRLANRFAIPVVEFWGKRVAVSCEDPMAAGRDPAPWFENADLVIVIESQTPWIPDMVAPAPQCPVIQIGPDPLFQKYPVRGFPLDVALCGETDLCLEALSEALERHFKAGLPAAIDARRENVSARNARLRDELTREAEAGSGDRISKAWVNRCLGSLSERHPTRIATELMGLKEFTGLTRPDVYFPEPVAAGLGFAFSIGLGMKLACPEELVVAAMGDGCYMFSNPVVCHQISMAAKLPLLVVVGNNREWRAVRNSTIGMYPDGFAARANTVPLSALDPTPDFCLIAQAAGAHAARVTNGGDLPRVLEEAAAVVMNERRTAFVEVMLS